MIKSIDNVDVLPTHHRGVGRVRLSRPSVRLQTIGAATLFESSAAEPCPGPSKSRSESMKNRWRSIFAMIIGGLLLVITNVPLPRVGSPEDRPMMGLGAWRSTRCVGTAVLFVQLYGSSAVACIRRTKAIKPTALLAPGALSA
jgi:hypothetical protein